MTTLTFHVFPSLPHSWRTEKLGKKQKKKRARFAASCVVVQMFVSSALTHFSPRVVVFQVESIHKQTISF